VNFRPGRRCSRPPASRPPAMSEPLLSPFVSRFGPWCVVAGASEGLGAAFADELGRRGVNLCLVARRQPELEALSKTLIAKYGVEVHPIVLDLASPTAADTLDRATRELDVGLLVFNACAAHIGTFISTPTDTLDSICAVNVHTMANVARRFAPRLSARHSGGIVLMSSMAGFHGHALAVAYAASKAFTTVLGEGLWAELEPLGIRVRVCAAGATTTPNFLAATPAAKRRLSMPMSAEQVVKVAIRALQDRNRGPVVVPPCRQTPSPHLSPHLRPQSS